MIAVAMPPVTVRNPASSHAIDINPATAARTNHLPSAYATRTIAAATINPRIAVPHYSIAVARTASMPIALPRNPHYPLFATRVATLPI